MNSHLDDGQLRASFDGELPASDLQHLQACPVCQARQSRLAQEARWVSGHLSFLASPAPDHAPAPRTALARFYQRANQPKENSMFRRLFASPALRIGLAVVVLLAVIVAVPSTRALADQLLNLFRVQQVAVVPVDFSGMQQLTGDSAMSKQISQLLASSINIEKKPGEPVTASDAAQASQLAGFTVRTPADQTPSQIVVQGGADFSFKVDRAKAQALLDEAGRSDLVLPEAVDGANVAVHVPSGVSVSYGDCPALTEENVGPMGGPTRRYPDCLVLAEIPSPTVDAPASVDVAQLAQIGLEFSGMSQQQAADFTKSIDWTSSLVIPIPKNAATYKQVSVDGVQGQLIQRAPDDAPQFALIWVKNGVIYAIGGIGNNVDQAIAMGNSLK